METESPVETRDRRWKTLIIISAAFCIFHLFLHARAPVSDGDSFEYAGIARNLFEHGVLREDLIRSYTIKDQALPHPPAQRASLYCYFLVPFYAAFRTTQWTFIIPAFIGLFLLPLAVFRVGGRLFGPDIGFYAALLSLFSPCLIRTYTLMDPGQPEVWQMILYIFFFYSLVKERYAVSGLLMAVAFLFRNNSAMLIPATLIWLFLHRRKALFGAPAFKLFGVALLPLLPFMIRSIRLFGSPFYSEQYSGISRVYGGMMIDRFREGDLFGIMFNYDAYNVLSPPAAMTFAKHAGYFLQVLWINVKLTLLGSQTGIFYMPGVFQTIGLILVPFFIYGIIVSRRQPEASFLSIICVIQTLFHTIVATYTDRYLLCILPFAFILCCIGLKDIQQRFSSRAGFPTRVPLAMSIVLFVLLSDSATFVVMNASRLFQQPQQSEMRELEVTCDYLRGRTGPEDVIMTYPFFATHFVCDRPTVPIPYGSLNTMAVVAKKYEVRHIIFAKVWPGDLFPDLPFASTIVRGGSITLFKVDRGLLDKYVSGHKTHYLDPFNPVAYFLSNRFDFEMAPPVYKLLIRFTHGFFAGGLLYLFIAILFIYLHQKQSGFTRTFLMILIALLFFSLQGFHMSKIFRPYLEADPQLSIISAEMLLKQIPLEKRRELIVLETEKNAALAARDLKPYFGVVSKIPAADKPADEYGNSTIFIPIPALRTWLSDEYSFARNIEIQDARSREVKKIIAEYRKRGFNTEPVYGGVFAY